MVNGDKMESFLQILYAMYQTLIALEINKMII